MLKTLTIATILSLALWSCSGKEDTGLDKARSSADKAIDSAKDAAANASDTAKDMAQDAARSVKEAGQDVKDAATSAGEQTKKGTRKVIKNLSDKPKDKPSAAVEEWRDFRASLKECDAMTGDEKKHCMADARDMYLAADFRCETLGSAKVECLRYHEQWNSAKASLPRAAITHTEEPTMSPATPGDPSAAERNRDSTKQQQDAAGTLTEPKRQN